MYCIYDKEVDFEIIVSLMLLSKIMKNFSHGTIQDFKKSNETDVVLLTREIDVEKIFDIGDFPIHVFSKTDIDDETNELIKERGNISIFCNPTKSFIRLISEKYNFVYPNNEIKSLIIKFEMYFTRNIKTDIDFMSAIEREVMQQTNIEQKLRMMLVIYANFSLNPSSTYDKFKAKGNKNSVADEKNKLVKEKNVAMNKKLEIYDDLTIVDYYSRGHPYYFLKVPEDFTLKELAKIHERFKEDKIEEAILVTYKKNNGSYVAEISTLETEDEPDLYEVFGRPDGNEKSIAYESAGYFYPRCVNKSELCFHGFATITDWDKFFPDDNS